MQFLQKFALWRAEEFSSFMASGPSPCLFRKTPAAAKRTTLTIRTKKGSGSINSQGLPSFISYPFPQKNGRIIPITKKTRREITSGSVLSFPAVPPFCFRGQLTKQMHRLLGTQQLSSIQKQFRPPAASQGRCRLLSSNYAILGRLHL